MGSVVTLRPVLRGSPGQHSGVEGTGGRPLNIPDDMTIYMENTEEATDKSLELIREFSTTFAQKCNIEK